LQDLDSAGDVELGRATLLSLCVFADMSQALSQLPIPLRLLQSEPHLFEGADVALEQHSQLFQFHLDILICGTASELVLQFYCVL
jgi:hypothetical protein